MMTELNKFGGRGEERLSARTAELTKKVENKYKNCVPYIRRYVAYFALFVYAFRGERAPFSTG